jgi:hypothetical protein
MKRNRNLIVGIILTATVGFVALQNGFAPASDSATQTPNITEAPVTTAPIEETCAYVWAYHNAPELTEKIDAAVRAIDPAASANADLFGEDCIYADGRSTFGAMETDFHVHLPVDDLTDEEAFGNWMAQIMPMIVEIPREEIQGNYGFVEFWFEKSDTENIIVRVPIQKYIDEAQGKTDTELFRMFYIKP